MVREIYLAGGCFWGLEKYLENIPGVISTEVGYANGNTNNPSYEDVCHKNTGHAETVKVEYDTDRIRLEFLLEQYYDVIDPTSENRQGGDTGSQYRTGIYFLLNEDKEIAQKSLLELQKKYNDKVVVEVMPLHNYTRAEEYHQKYLNKHKNGYCHIPSSKFIQAKTAVEK